MLEQRNCSIICCVTCTLAQRPANGTETLQSRGATAVSTTAHAVRLAKRKLRDGRVLRRLRWYDSTKFIGVMRACISWYLLRDNQTLTEDEPRSASNRAHLGRREDLIKHPIGVLLYDGHHGTVARPHLLRHAVDCRQHLLRQSNMFGKPWFYEQHCSQCAESSQPRCLILLQLCKLISHM